MMSTSEVNLTLPTGRLSLHGDGTAKVLLRSSIRHTDTLLAAVEALSQLNPGRFWLHTDCQPEAEGLCLTYARPDGKVSPLPQLVRHWRDEPAVAICRTLELVRWLLPVTAELEQLHPRRFHLSPAQVFVVQDEAEKEHWLVLPLPSESAGFADFMRADEGCWAWLSADELLGAVQSDRAYMIGAALYYCLIADLFPAEFSRAERVRRLLLYRAGNTDLARRTLLSALPEAQAAGRLYAFIMSLLTPTIGRVLTTVQAARELDGFYTELSPHKLACQWELVGEEQQARSYIQRARRIIETLVARAPDDEVPWAAVARLREKDGDLVAAAVAAGHLHKPQAGNSFIAHVRSLIAAGEEQRPELARLTAMLREMSLTGPPPQVSSERELVRGDQTGEEKPSAPPLSEEEYLYLVYAHGRWLAQPDEALLYLQRTYNISWNKVVRSILAARLQAEKADWIKVAASCREGRRLIEKMSVTGGERGRYADAYLDLLDGIAHISAVQQQTHAPEYLTDAFNRLESAWMTLQESAATDLHAAIIAWLSRLAVLACRNPRLTLLCLGVEAFIQSFGVPIGQQAQAETPSIPWFDETRLFTW